MHVLLCFLRLLCSNPTDALKLRLSDENLLKDAAIAEGDLCLGSLADREFLNAEPALERALSTASTRPKLLFNPDPVPRNISSVVQTWQGVRCSCLPSTRASAL
jgi:hypothetical protein